MEAFFAECCVCCASPTPPLPVTPPLPNFGPPGTVALHPTPPAYPPPTRMLPSEIRHINDMTASERFRKKRPGQPPQRSVARWVPPTAKAKALSLVHKGSKRWQTVGAKRRKTIETIICEAVVRSLERENSVLEQERQEIATIEEPRWQRGRVGVYTLAFYQLRMMLAQNNHTISISSCTVHLLISLLISFLISLLAVEKV